MTMKLLSCPFCGGPAYSCKTEVENSTGYYADAWMVGCETCDAKVEVQDDLIQQRQSPAELQQKAEEQWKRRVEANNPQAKALAAGRSSDCSDRPFALFAGATYYPAPGWKGYRGNHATVEEATSTGKKLKLAEEQYGWWQVVDLRELKIVAGEGGGHTGLFGMCPAV